MPDNPYPEWRRRRCRYCEAGWLTFCGRHQSREAIKSFKCTAPTEAEYIAELEDDRTLLDWCEATALAHPELQRDGLVPMTRAAIRAAMKESDPAT